MEVRNEEDFDFEEVTCPVCGGKGCELCGFKGYIRVRTDKPIVKSPPKIIVEASDQEVDKLMTEIGRLSLSDPVAKKEYVAAFAYYKAIIESIRRLTDPSDPQSLYNQFQDIIEEVARDNLDEIDSVDRLLLLVKDLLLYIQTLEEKIKVMAERFEIMGEILDREIEKKEMEIADLEKQAEKFRKMYETAVDAQMVKESRFIKEVKENESDEYKEEKVEKVKKEEDLANMLGSLLGEESE